MTNSSIVSTAAAAAAVIPFHCVICFEEFNLGVRFPVVLPCGHTYVCNPCARRLNRCMECREPLFLRTESVPKTPPTNTHRSGPPLYPQGRYHQAPPSPVPIASHHDPIALPLPKNIVLMSMMEAAERQQREELREAMFNKKKTDEKLAGSPNIVDKNDNPDCNGNDGDDEEEEDEEEDDVEEDEDDELYDLNKIISGLVTFSGPCGTYAVREPNGLAVLPHHPEKQLQTESEPDTSKEEKDAIPEPFSIVKGQTIQIVNFHDGVATLARGAGYIVATSSQLVKVGGPLDKCCRLEGMVATLSLRGYDLQKALDENRNFEADLKQSIEVERRSAPIHPIITEPAQHDEIDALQKGSSDTLSQSENVGDEQLPLLPHSPREVIVTETDDSSGLELVRENRVKLYSDPPSPNSIDNSEISNLDATAPGMPRYRRNSDDDLNAFAYGCGSALFGKDFLNFGEEPRVGLSFDSLDSSSGPRPQPRLPTSSSSSQPQRSSPVQQIQRQTQVSDFMSAATPILSSSFDAVDWRTGMSGHRGLSKTSPRANSTITRASIRMMSEHRGAGSVRSSRQSNSPTSSPSFGPPFATAKEYCGHDLANGKN